MLAVVFLLSGGVLGAVVGYVWAHKQKRSVDVELIRRG